MDWGIAVMESEGGKGYEFLVSSLLPKKINMIVISEEEGSIGFVNNFKIEYSMVSSGLWDEVYSGKSIGKELVIHFETVVCFQIRVTITKASEKPYIKSIKIYYS